MTILASVVADAINADGARLTTFIVRCPATTVHTLASIDGLSISRPYATLPPDQEVKRLLAWCADTPAPFPTQRYTGPIDEFSKRRHDLMWKQFREEAIKTLRFWAVNAHAPSVDIAQRVLSCWLYEVVVITATDWAPLWLSAANLSTPEDVVDVVTEMRKALNGSVPNKCVEGQQYLPFITAADEADIALTAFDADTGDGLTMAQLCDACAAVAYKVSVARCARQGNGDPKKFTLKDDLRLYELLLVEGRVERYAEHQAFADTRVAEVWKNASTHGNFRGWGKLKLRTGD